MKLHKGVLALAALLAAGAQSAYAQGQGVTATEIKIGQTTAYSGPASAYSTIAKAEAAYFAMINKKGGVNGRKINFISVDDAYSPPKTFEQTRKLVEQDGVAAILNPLGTPTGLVVRKYLNEKKIPQLFVGAGATMFGDPKHFPYTIGYQPNYHIEASIYARHAMQTQPNAKIALFYQNDDAGRDYANGFKAGLGGPENVKKYVIFETTYESTDPTIDSKIVALKNSGANVLFMHAIPKQAAQAIRRVAEIGWKPTFYLANVSASVGAVLKPAGVDNAKGLITASWIKDPADKQWKEDAGYKNWLAFMKEFYPSGDLIDGLNVYGYTVAQTMVKVLQQCGDKVSSECMMKEAANLDFAPEMLLPGIAIKTSATEFYPIKKMYLQKFDGAVWQLFGSAMSAN
ncbi:MAG TPA: ABC transporter substrate-binding protein [Beijerinckiaceae bacterium]|nr:ABC transporter substrate-binding protein [Methylobacteriaceae bacterium]HRY04635.1 ABC transporter substrate-binding protein [Beijerinckiaceae bacterium]